MASTRRRLLIDHSELIIISKTAQTSMLLDDLLLLLTGRQSMAGLLLLLLLLQVICLRVSIAYCVVLFPVAGHRSVLLWLHWLIHQPRVSRYGGLRVSAWADESI